MRLQLPNGEERILDNNISLDEKRELCEQICEEFEQEIHSGWDTHKIRYFLNGLSNYLCWHKEENYRDKENGILSNSREKQMERVRYHGRWRKDTVFTDLMPTDEFELFGEMRASEE